MNPSNTTGPVLWSVDGRGVATVTLNRPEVNNAYNGELIQGLLAALDALGGAPGLRAVDLEKALIDDANYKPVLERQDVVALQMTCNVAIDPHTFAPSTITRSRIGMDTL